MKNSNMFGDNMITLGLCQHASITLGKIERHFSSASPIVIVLNIPLSSLVCFDHLLSSFVVPLPSFVVPLLSFIVPCHLPIVTQCPPTSSHCASLSFEPKHDVLQTKILQPWNKILWRMVFLGCSQKEKGHYEPQIISLLTHSRLIVWRILQNRCKLPLLSSRHRNPSPLMPCDLCTCRFMICFGSCSMLGNTLHPMDERHP